MVITRMISIIIILFVSFIIIITLLIFIIIIAIIRVGVVITWTVVCIIAPRDGVSSYPTVNQPPNRNPTTLQKPNHHN